MREPQIELKDGTSVVPLAPLTPRTPVSPNLALTAVPSGIIRGDHRRNIRMFGVAQRSNTDQVRDLLLAVRDGRANPCKDALQRRICMAVPNSLLSTRRRIKIRDVRTSFWPCLRFVCSMLTARVA